MKNLIYIIAFFISFSSGQLQGQTTPQPPTPPGSSKSVSHSQTISRSSSSSRKSSISITKNEQEYSLKAKFGKDKMSKLKALFLSELGDKNFTISNGTHIWKTSSGGETVYLIELEKNRLKMNLDRSLASDKLFTSIDELGLLAKSIISGQKHGDADRLRREADRLKEEADRLNREAGRLNREAERSSKLQQKAHDLEATSRRLVEESMHKGGISTEIKMLLADGKTFYNFKNSSSSKNWFLPVFQSELLNKIQTLDLIDHNEELRLIIDPSGIYINGKKLISNQHSSIANIFDEYNILKAKDFQFYKKGNHVVVVSGDSDIEGFFRAFAQAGYISNHQSKVELNINGHNLLINDELADDDTLAKINSMMQNYRILPAPGKILYSMGGGKYQLGYSLGVKSLLGTWIF